MCIVAGVCMVRFFSDLFSQVPWLLATCNKVFEFMEASSRPDSFIYYNYYYYCIYYTCVVRTTLALEILQQPNSLAKLGLSITSEDYTMLGVHD